MRWVHFWPIVILLVNLAGLSLIYRRVDKSLSSFASATSLDALRVTTADISDTLASIQNQLTRLQSPDSTSPVLGGADVGTNTLSDLLPAIPDSSSTLSLSHIRVSDDSQGSVPVYKEQADFSAIIGQLIPGQKYPYSTKINHWYQVNLSQGASGWVKAESVREIP